MRELVYTRTPKKNDVIAVLATAVFMVYTWTLYVSFWKLPSWLFFLDFGEIFSIYAYAFLVNFLESILLLLTTLALSLVLPRSWWKEAFVPRGFTLILAILVSAQTHLYFYQTPDTRSMFVHGQLAWWLNTLWVTIILTWVAGRFAWLQWGLKDLADRLIVFMYIYLPLTAIAIVVVTARILL